MHRLLLGALPSLASLVVLMACGGPQQQGPSAQVDVSAPVDARESVTVVAVGDIACAAGERVTVGTCQQAATARLAASRHPDAVVALGDLQYQEGALSDFMASYDKSWGSLRSITRPLPGNHEYSSDGAAGYFAYFDQAQPWYAWDAAGWRVYMLNSNCGDVDCAAEQAWLKQDLADNPRECSAIATHHPRYSSGRHHSDDSMAAFWQIAYDAHVDLALSGHDHHYERFAAMDAQRHLSPGRGITSFVSGAGGRSLYPEHDAETGSARFEPGRFGVLDLTLAATGFSWEFLATDGAVLDRGSTPCG